MPSEHAELVLMRRLRLCLVPGSSSSELALDCEGQAGAAVKAQGLRHEANVDRNKEANSGAGRVKVTQLLKM